mgnify:CR=1 FL=1
MRGLGAKARIDGSKLDTDRAGAHHDQRLRHVFQFENVIAVDDVYAVSFKTGMGRTTEPVAMMMFLVSRSFVLRRRRR